MTTPTLPLAAALALTSMSLAGAAEPQAAAEEPKSRTARAAFTDARGRELGEATLTQAPAGVLIELRLAGLPPGEHALHIHERGRCDAGTGFKSAGDHFAPRGNAHGYHDAKGPHAGDLPNVFADDAGRLRAHLLATRVSLERGETSLLDADGAALVVHARPDDYRSQPAGDAGDRIACAVIEPAAR